MTTPLIRTANGGFAHPDDPGEPGYGDSRPRWSITPRECLVLAGLAHGRDVLEIGTGLGVSTRALASTARSIVTHDVDPWVAQAIAPNLPANVVFASARDAAADRGPWSLAFIDGLHQRDAVAEDIAFAVAGLARPGLLVLHDGRMAHVQEGIEASGVKLDAAYPLQTEAGLVLIFLGEGS